MLFSGTSMPYSDHQDNRLAEIEQANKRARSQRI